MHYVQGLDEIYVIDIDPSSPSFNTVIAGPTPVGRGPNDIALTPDGKRVYVPDGSPNVYVFDADPASPTFNTVIGGPIPVGDNSVGGGHYS